MLRNKKVSSFRQHRAPFFSDVILRNAVTEDLLFPNVQSKKQILRHWLRMTTRDERLRQFTEPLRIL